MLGVLASLVEQGERGRVDALQDFLVRSLALSPGCGRCRVVVWSALTARLATDRTTGAPSNCRLRVLWRPCVSDCRAGCLARRGPRRSGRAVQHSGRSHTTCWTSWPSAIGARRWLRCCSTTQPPALDRWPPWQPAIQFDTRPLAKVIRLRRPAARAPLAHPDAARPTSPLSVEEQADARFCSTIRRAHRWR